MESLPGHGVRETSRGVLLPWVWVRVQGPSMVPTLRTGDRVLVRVGGRVAPGDVALATFADLDVPVVKRVRAVTGGRTADLRSDNDAAGGDSRTHGPGHVVGRAVLVVRRWRPRRVAAAPVL